MPLVKGSSMREPKPCCRVLACVSTPLSCLSGPLTHCIRYTFPGELLEFTFTGCTMQAAAWAEPGELLCTRLCSAPFTPRQLESSISSQCPHALTHPEHIPAACASATINQPATYSALGASEHQREGFAFSCSALGASALTFELCHYFFKR